MKLSEAQKAEVLQKLKNLEEDQKRISASLMSRKLPMQETIALTVIQLYRLQIYQMKLLLIIL